MEEAQKGNDQTRAGLQADAWFGSVKAAVALGKKGYIKLFCKSKLDMGIFQKSSLKRLSKKPLVVSGLYLSLFAMVSH
jgi:hypothetical protein